jgi:bifunctional non-homologous end joining protein LigD
VHPLSRMRASAGPTEVAGVRITHPDRVMYSEARLSKLDIARYYERIADWIVPHVERRPLTLVRCPTGPATGCFYMKHSKVWAPPALQRVNIQEKTKIGEYLVANSGAALVSLAQMDVLEIHTWNSRVGCLEQPDRLVLDIDPGPEVTWAEVIAAARLVRRVLEGVDLASFVKTTGGRGLHVVVPLRPSADWSECLAFSRRIAEAIVAQDPARYTTRFAKAGRERKILIDYLRNNRTNTSVAAYSMRAKPHAPVSMPLTWTALSARTTPGAFSVKTVPARLSRLRRDPWAEYWSCRQRLTRAMITAVAVPA